jgi:hypothetical protein
MFGAQEGKKIKGTDVIKLKMEKIKVHKKSNTHIEKKENESS